MHPPSTKNWFSISFSIFEIASCVSNYMMATSPNSSAIKSTSTCVTPSGGTCFSFSSKQFQNISQSPSSLAMALLKRT
jgi:hypothetical protein